MASDPGAEEAADDLRVLLGDGPLPFPERTEREFQPWHRPRKQYVRSTQWSRELELLARDISLAGELRYLTLPGRDLLDVRHVAESVCAPRNVRLRYLGFNAAASPSDVGQPELNAAQFSINRLECIHPESEVFPGDFRGVGNPRSIPWQRIRRAGPFHAINLDLCGGFAGSERAQGIPNYFTALQALLQNQRSSDEEFLLFITTRMDDDSVDAEVQARLNQATQAVFDTCEAYASEFMRVFGTPLQSDVTVMRDVVSAAEGFMLGLTQWIVSQGVAHGLRASVRSFMTYRTGSGAGDDDIVSLAIRFKPDPYIQPDSQGLVRQVGAAPSLEGRECEQSARIPKCVGRRALVDEILGTQTAEFRRCLNESSDLLSASGYDAKAYRDWVMREAHRYAVR